MSKDMKNFYLLFAISVVTYFVTYDLNVLLARHLTADIYGEYNLAIRVLNLFVALALFGTNLQTQRFLPQYLQMHKESSAVDYIAWNLKLLSKTFLIIFLLAILSFTLMLVFHIYKIRDINHYHLTLYMLWVAPIAAMSSLMATFLMSCKQVVLASSILGLFPRLIQLFFFMTIVLFLHIRLDNITIIMTIFITFLLLSMLAFFSTNKEIRHLIKEGLKRMGSTRINNDWLKTALRLIGSHIIIMLIILMDLTIVTLFVQNKTHVGYFAAILTITSAISLIPNIVYQTIKPELSTLLGSKPGRKKLQQRLAKLNFLNVLIIALVGAGIIYYSTTLLSHFGPAYIIAQAALVIRTISACIEAICRICVPLLINKGFEQLLLNFRVAQLLLILVCVIPATYFYDITGTALASGVVMVCMNGFVLVKTVRNNLGIKPLSIC